jgi:large subunit ribosomal protein L10
MMKKTEKEAAIKGMEGVLADARSIYLADFQGMTVEVISELRKRCRKANVRFQVGKNTLFARAAQATGHEALLPHLNGPTALATSATDEVAPARVLADFLNEFKSPQIKGGLVAGKFYDEQQVKALAKLPPKEIILGSFLRVLQAPLSQFASVLHAPLRNLASVLDQVAKQKGAA